MIRGLFRLLSMLALAIAIVMAVIDAARSVAAETVLMTPLGATWQSLFPASLAGLREMVTAHLPDYAWDVVAVGLLGLPGFAVFAVLSLLLGLAGHRRVRRDERYASYR